MAYLDRFNKQPADVKKYQITYAEWLDTSVTITTVVTAVVLLNKEDGDVGEPALSIGNTSIIGGEIFQYYASSGTDGKKYKVTFQATTSDAQIVESEIEFRIKDI